MPTKKTLASALLEAQKKIHAIGKDARNSYSKYDYTSAESMIAACREVLLECGLTIQRTKSDMAEVCYRTITGKDNASVELACTQLHMTFKLSHAESGESEEYHIDYPAQERIGTPLDKAVSAALTTSLSYMLRDLLNIPRVDKDSLELDQVDDSQFRGRTQNGSAKKQTPPATPAPKNELREVQTKVNKLLIEIGGKEHVDEVFRYVTGGEVGRDRAAADIDATKRVLDRLTREIGAIKVNAEDPKKLTQLAIEYAKEKVPA